VPRTDDPGHAGWSQMVLHSGPKSGYWQVGLHPEDMEKTTFSMVKGLWLFTAMSFGFCSVPATFERLIETVLRDLTYESCLEPGRCDRDWPHVPKAPVQPAEIVPAVMRSPPKAQSGEVPTLPDRSTVPRAHYITLGDNHRLREFKIRRGMADPEE
jgi:hypothetical protein